MGVRIAAFVPLDKIPIHGSGLPQTTHINLLSAGSLFALNSSTHVSDNRMLFLFIQMNAHHLEQNQLRPAYPILPPKLWQLLSTSITWKTSHGFPGNGNQRSNHSIPSFMVLVILNLLDTLSLDIVSENGHQGILKCLVPGKVSRQLGRLIPLDCPISPPPSQNKTKNTCQTRRIVDQSLQLFLFTP